MSIVKILEEIEKEIKQEYIGPVIKWADEKYNNAWSNAIDEFEKSLCEDLEVSRKAAEKYKAICLGYIYEFKKEKNLDEIELYLSNQKRR